MAATTLGFIGLGVMGEPMCANLARKSGLAVLCHDLDAAPVQRLAAHGAVPAASLDALAEQADAVFLCLASAAATEQVVDRLLGCWAHRPGRMVIDTGTTSLAATRRIAARLQAQGHRFLDAPIARMPAAAIAGTLSIMVGGSAQDLTSALPWLRCMGSDVTHCGATGSGQTVKILHNTVLIETVHALAEAMALARRLGVDGAVLLDAIELGSADCKASRVQGRQALLPRDYPQGRFGTRYALKDVGLALELAQLAGGSARLAAETAAVLQQTVDAGWGDRYYPALYETIAADGRTPP